MNVFQKTGIFVIRIVGVVTALIALAGFAYLAFAKIRGAGDTVPPARVAGSVEWLAIGVVLLVFSKPLGKMIGAGLG